MFIEISRAGREFDGHWAVRDLSTNLHAGSVIAVLGANMTVRWWSRRQGEQYELF